MDSVGYKLIPWIAPNFRPVILTQQTLFGWKQEVAGLQGVKATAKD